MTVSIIKTYEDRAFPWLLSVKKNGVLIVCDYFSQRPAMTKVFQKIEEAEVTL